MENVHVLFQNFSLHANQSGVFVCSIDVTEFVGWWVKTIKFFISYEIKGSVTNAKMTMNAGEAEVDASTLYGTESEIRAGKTEIYKDLLAVTATSTLVLVDVKFEKLPKLNFQEFLKSRLKFCQLGGVCDAEVDVKFLLTSL